jgi:hypothetical protein
MIPSSNLPHVQPCAKDRAAVVTTTILQVIETSLRALLRGEPAGASALRAQVEATLRDEFADNTRAALNEIPLPDE